MNSMYGYSFSVMSDSFLVECFDELSVACQMMTRRSVSNNGLTVRMS